MNTDSSVNTSPSPPTGASRPSVLFRPRWNPYVVGIGIGILSWLAFGVAGKGIGMSTQISQAAGATAIPFVGADAVHANAYWARHVPKFWDYSMLFLVGTFLGALVSSLISRSWKPELVPSVWAQRFGPSAPKRLIVAFLGGILALYGARMAGGCTSGHGITGSLQLAISSWTFFMVMFAAGVLTAAIMFHRRSPSTVNH